MLALAGHSLGIPQRIFGSPDSPAGIVCAETLNNARPDALKRFFHSTRGVILESEFVDSSKITKAGGENKILPNLESIRVLQNKLSQKILLRKAGIPTSDFLEPALLESPDDWLEECAQRFGDAFVLKFATLGYDGKGVYIHKPEEGLGPALSFLQIARDRKIRVFCEKKVDYERELAMAACVKTNGEMNFYPLVISEQRQGICDFVYGPAIAFGVAETQEAVAQEILRTIARETKLVGTFAVEFFESEMQLLVNEIAPRVHNSAHYTLDGCHTSQFENHWRAVLDLPLGSVETAPFFAMANLIGTTHRDVRNFLPPKIPAGLHLHWYGKKESRPGRKMGHINTWSLNSANAQDQIAKLRKVRDQWQNELL